MEQKTLIIVLPIFTILFIISLNAWLHFIRDKLKNKQKAENVK
jgi:hypothetical protein